MSNKTFYVQQIMIYIILSTKKSRKLDVSTLEMKHSKNDYLLNFQTTGEPIHDL